MCAPGPPPSNGGIFPAERGASRADGDGLDGLYGDKPEPMQVEILGVLRGARGPGQDMILAQLHGAKPEYTGVVAGMSGSPVYIGNKLLGSLSYRIGQFSKDPIAGITPIEQMLEVRDLPMRCGAHRTETGAAIRARRRVSAAGMTFQTMETPLVMSGFRPEAIRAMAGKDGGNRPGDGGGRRRSGEFPAGADGATADLGRRAGEHRARVRR